ncbi:MAG: efflux RND transporter permease subunit [Muribaculaceae bacterium]|nr:efflux RND transporter permease subunit [Muribaculaceae bacterium]
MLNKIINFSLNNRLTILIVTALVLIAGTVTLVHSEIDIFPDLNAPTVVVMTEAPGMAPEEVEKLVTYPIETAVNGASGVRRVRSTSNTGFSIVDIEFDWITDVMEARQIVSERLGAVSEKLPPGVETPVMGPQSSILGEMLIIGLSADSTDLMELRTIADKVISPRLLGLGGVAQVSVLGGDVKQYQIQLDPELMKAYGVTVDEVIGATSGLNDNARGSLIYDWGNEYVIKGDVNTSSLDDLSLAVVRSDQSGQVTLGDIATITVAPESPTLGKGSVNGRPAVLVTVTKQPGTATTQLTDDILAQLDDIKTTLPPDVNVNTEIFRQADFIENSISNLQESLLEGALFVILVLFVFLMNVRTTVISAVVLPLSIIVTVIILHLMGYTLNTMSLGGIAIAIGSLVDDAIVDVENVYKRLRQNRLLPPDERQPVLRVVYQASAEVRMPIFNSSLIIIAAFVPLFFLSGVEGRMLIPLGVSFIVALIASTIVALTLTPVLCSLLLGTGKENKELSREPYLTRKMKGCYEKLLRVAIRYRRAMLITVGAIFVICCVLFAMLGRSFLPPFNEGSLTVNVSTLPGISLEESDKVGRLAEEILLSMPEIKTTARKTGRAELAEHSFGSNVSEIEAPYTLDAGRTRNEMVRDLRDKLSEIPGTNIEIGQPISHRIDAMLSGTEAQIAIKLFGDDLTRLYTIGNNIKQVAQEVDGVVDVNIEQQIMRPEISIKPRREMLARYGVTLPTFHQALETALSGVEVSQVYEGGIPFDVVVIYKPDTRSTIDALKDILIDTNSGAVPLEQLATISSTTGPNTVNRENIKRRIVISANVQERDLRSTVNEIRTKIEEEIKLPEGYYVSYGGQFESEAAATRTLAWASLGALLVIFMLLYHDFKSASQSLLILINMPLAMIGGVLILVFTGAELNIPAIIGFISLLGISTRNGMLLMSRFNGLKEEGIPLMQRIYTGSVDRLLPIVMTALTSALALIPLAVAGNKPGNEIQSPLAVVILGGLISSTLLNVFVVPTIYFLMNRKEDSNNQ